VVIRGRAEETSRLHDALDAMELPLFPWHAEPEPRFVRIEPDSVARRRFHVVGGVEQEPPATPE
jgi:hypothetical protein